MLESKTSLPFCRESVPRMAWKNQEATFVAASFACLNIAESGATRYGTLREEGLFGQVAQHFIATFLPKSLAVSQQRKLITMKT
jgi:hypothetical protein